MMTSETDSEAVAKLLDDFEKNAALQRDQNFKYLDDFMWQLKSTNDFTSRQRLIRRCKKFQKMIIIFNNVLSFISENAKMNELHSV